VALPGKKVVWHVTGAELNVVKDKDEWNGTDIVRSAARRERPSCASPTSAVKAGTLEASEGAPVKGR
jgi:hypothetical protein